MPVDYLTVEQRYRLDEACRAIGEAFEAVGAFGVYLVGSVMKRPDAFGSKRQSRRTKIEQSPGFTQQQTSANEEFP